MPRFEADVRGKQEYDGSDPKYFVLLGDRYDGKPGIICDTLNCDTSFDLDDQRKHMGMIAAALNMVWEPIDTAPKGKPLLGEDGPRVLLGWNHKEDIALGRYERHGWVDGYGGAIHNPTHWMPIPTGPKK